MSSRRRSRDMAVAAILPFIMAELNSTELCWVRMEEVKGTPIYL